MIHDKRHHDQSSRPDTSVAMALITHGGINEARRKTAGQMRELVEIAWLQIRGEHHVG